MVGAGSRFDLSQAFVNGLGGIPTGLHTQPAPAQLDNFYCVKIWTRTVLGDFPGWVCKLKRALIVHEGLAQVEPPTTRDSLTRNLVCRGVSGAAGNLGGRQPTPVTPRSLVPGGPTLPAAQRRSWRRSTLIAHARCAARCSVLCRLRPGSGRAPV